MSILSYPTNSVNSTSANNKFSPWLTSLFTSLTTLKIKQFVSLSILRSTFNPSLPIPHVRPTPYTRPRESLNALFKNSNKSWPPISSPSTVPFPLSLYIELADEIPSHMSSKSFTHTEFMMWMDERLSKDMSHQMDDIMRHIDALQPGDSHYEAMLSCLSVCILSYRWGPLPYNSSTSCTPSRFPEELFTPFQKLTSQMGLPNCPTLYSTILCNWSEYTKINIDGEDIICPLDTRFTFNVRDDNDIRSTTERGFYLSVIRMESMAKKMYEDVVNLIELVNGGDYERNRQTNLTHTIINEKEPISIKNQKVVDAISQVRHSAAKVFRIFYAMAPTSTRSSNGCPFATAPTSTQSSNRCPFATPYEMSATEWSPHAQVPTGWQLSGLKGISGAQSMIIPVIDAILSCGGTSPAYIDAVDSYTNYTTSTMRNFIDSIKKAPVTLREFVLNSKSSAVKEEYNRLVDSLAVFRMGHRAVGKKYLGGGESYVEAINTAGELIEKLKNDNEGTVDTFSRAMTERIRETKNMLI